MTEKKAAEPKLDDVALVKTTRYLMTEAGATRDPRIVELAQKAIEMVKEGNGVEALLMMIPDDENIAYGQPQMPQQQRRRR